MKQGGIGETLILILLVSLTCSLKAQTYTVGDTVDNFGAPICYNGEGDWEYQVNGHHKVTWISSFATW